jgi:hypothetical protein
MLLYLIKQKMQNYNDIKQVLPKFGVKSYV